MVTSNSLYLLYRNREVIENFSADRWAWNGGGILTRLANEICRAKDIHLMALDRCHLFHVYPLDVFHPITKWQFFYFANYSTKALEMVKDSIGVHALNSLYYMWGKLKTSDRLDPNTAYMIIAKKFCPNVYNFSAEFF